MKSAACCTRRLCGTATFDEDEPSAVPSSSSSSFFSSSSSSSEARSNTCHCHCPWNRGAFEDAPASPLSASVCERLRDRTDHDLLDAIRTEDDLVFGRRHGRLRRKRDGNDSPTNHSKATDQKRDRTSKCERVPLCESSARCASNVVRWSSVARFVGRSKSWRRLFAIIFLILALPGLVAAQRRANNGPSKEDGGEYTKVSSFISLARAPIFLTSW